MTMPATATRRMVGVALHSVKSLALRSMLTQSRRRRRSQNNLSQGPLQSGARSSARATRLVD